MATVEVSGFLKLTLQKSNILNPKKEVWKMFFLFQGVIFRLEREALKTIGGCI